MWTLPLQKFDTAVEVITCSVKFVASRLFVWLWRIVPVVSNLPRYPVGHTYSFCPSYTTLLLTIVEGIDDVKKEQDGVEL